MTVFFVAQERGQAMHRNRYHNQLRRFRREIGLSQKEVAAILGLKSAAPVSRWEKGIVLPETLNALKLAALYRSSVDVIYSDLRFELCDELAHTGKTVLDN
jgi:transcriptional regulator with XRE-family HTH domain